MLKKKTQTYKKDGKSGAIVAVVKKTWTNFLVPGREIDIEQGECNWDGSIAYASEDRHKYITKGDTLRCWLEKNLGPATVVSVNKLKYHVCRYIC